MKATKFGRCGDVDGKTVLFWSGSALEVCVRASELYVIIETDYDIHELWADFIIDGERTQRLALQKGVHKYMIFRGFEASSKTKVRVVRDTQSMPEDNVSYFAIHGFETDGEFLDESHYDMQLEFIGDSITSGEGCGLTNREEWIPAVFDAVNAFPYLTSQILNAKYNVLSQSGWGTFASWDADTSHAIVDYYEKICGTLCDEKNIAAHAHEDWNFEDNASDAIIINLGTNDSNAMKLEKWSKEEFASLFIDKAYNFIKNVRRHNPHSLILWVYGMLGNDMEPYIQKALQQYKDETGDEKVQYLALENCTGELLGVRLHPTPQAHRVAAKQIADTIIRNLSAK